MGGSQPCDTNERLIIMTNPAAAPSNAAQAPAPEVPQVVLPPQMVTLGKRGAVVAKILSDAKKEMETLKTTFETFFVANNTRTATDKAGKVLAIRTHGEPNTLDQAAFKAAHPKIAAEYTWPHAWDSVAFKG